ncbi:hypothetical protein EVAR_39136_1 [Eumeta japonica]|uniref:Uncharacterized protein n=1 Tax=Eumeta variegata TaxID=151549 RepID=A0A4C1X841_EUMVA|nr:hypothetical protein EVAR_39136_1 [Eumeta japonica]
MHKYFQPERHHRKRMDTKCKGLCVVAHSGKSLYPAVERQTDDDGNPKGCQRSSVRKVALSVHSACHILTALGPGNMLYFRKRDQPSAGSDGYPINIVFVNNVVKIANV